MKNLLLVMVALIVFVATGCNKNELDIEKGFDFSLSMRPLPFKLRKYSSTDVRIRINRDGFYQGTKYKVSFVQFTGNGTLANEEGALLVQNGTYELSSDIFTLKYTSYGDTEHFLEVTVSDNFGRVKKQKVKMLNDDSVDQNK